MSIGLDIHFYRVKPNVSQTKLKILPLLILHGWPGSVVEFQKIISLLTTPRPDKDFVFEVIAPSLPGYGFSQAAVRQGLGPPQVKFTEKMSNNFIKWRNIHTPYQQGKLFILIEYGTR